MAFIEALPAIAEAAEAGGGAEAAGGGGILRDFNDNPVMKTVGSHLGQAVRGHSGGGGGGGGPVGSDPEYIGDLSQMRGSVI